MSLCFALVKFSLSSILLIPVGIVVVAGLLWLQRSLQIFTRGTVAFMAVVVLVTAVISLVDKGQSIRINEDRALRITQRQVALRALDSWCGETFDVYSRFTVSGRAVVNYEAVVIDVIDSRGALWGEQAKIFKSKIKHDYDDLLKRGGSVTSRVVAINMGHGRDFFARSVRYSFTVVIDVQATEKDSEPARLHPPRLIVRGSVRLSALDGEEKQWVVKALRISDWDDCSPEEGAQQFYESEFQDHTYKVNKIRSSRNRYGRRSFIYAWDQ